jgi:hypothetical protein
MSNILPEGEDLRRAIKWISAHLQENPGQSVNPLVHEATFKFDLSPRDADFLLMFYRKKKDDEQ